MDTQHRGYAAAVQNPAHSEPTWTPDWSVPPGDILREALHERDTTPADLAETMHRTPAVINNIINGKTRIKAEIALQLEKALGISADFWVQAQAQHELHLARQHAKKTERTNP